MGEQVHKSSGSSAANASHQQIRREHDEEHSASNAQISGSSAHSTADGPTSKHSESPPNHTGLPDSLKLGIEQLSGYSMDDVKVHFNSDRPTQLKAYAYAQGNNIHIGPGHERHLPHEAWHVVQQKQGRVKANKQLKGDLLLNDDVQLEREADVMGEKALYVGKISVKDAREPWIPSVDTQSLPDQPVQRVPQPILGQEGRFTDSRNAEVVLEHDEGNNYTVVGDGIQVTHVTATDQYLMAEDTYWDPVSGGDSFIQLNHNYSLYRSMNHHLYKYQGGQYVPLTALESFLRAVWALRGTNGLVGGEAPSKQALNTVYNNAYSGQTNKVMPAHQTELLINIADWVVGRNGRPQSQAVLLGGVPTDNIHMALNILSNPGMYEQQPWTAAYNMISKNYFFIDLHGGVAMNHRIVINALPASVLHVAQQIYGIVSHHNYNTCVNRFKFAGPNSARTKKDAVIIYCNKNDGQFNNLLEAITGANLAVHIADGVPGLMQQAADGIGSGDQPDETETGNLSFGQKRVSLAVLALRHDRSSVLNFLKAGVVFFQLGGINPVQPSREHGAPTDPRIVAGLNRHRNIFYS